MEAAQQPFKLLIKGVEEMNLGKIRPLFRTDLQRKIGFVRKVTQGFAVPIVGGLVGEHLPR